MIWNIYPQSKGVSEVIMRSEYHQAPLTVPKKISHFCDSLMKNDSVQIQLSVIENLILQKFNYVDSAEVSTDVKGRMSVQIWEKQILAKVQSKKRGLEYLTKDFKIFPAPTKDPITKIPFLKGAVHKLLAEDEHRQDLKYLTEKISAKEKIVSQISSIFISNSLSIRVYLKKRTHVINLGVFENIESKVKNLYALFRYIIPQMKTQIRQEFDLQNSNYLIVHKPL